MMNEAIKMSVVSPVYGAASSLPELVSRLQRSVSQISENYEIILVEDNSPDNSWEIIRQLAAADNRIIGLSLSRNFGQQYALNAGLDAARGDWIVTLDCDLQDEPERIIDLYNEAMKGYDMVMASRVNRHDGFLKKIASRLFYKVLGYLTETNQDHSVANFVLYHKKVVAAMAQMGDYYKYYPMLNRWVGFKTAKLPIPHAKRKDRVRSSYSFKKRLRLALTTIITFSDKPLRMVLKFGVLLVAGNLLLALIFAFKYIAFGQRVSGWLSIFLSIWLLSGIIIVILGMIGTYMGKLFETVKGRPAYIVKETTKK